MWNYITREMMILLCFSFFREVQLILKEIKATRPSQTVNMVILTKVRACSCVRVN